MLSWWVCKCCSRPSGCGCDADASPTGYDRINRRIQSIPPFDTATINVWWMRYRPYRLYFHPSIHPSLSFFILIVVFHVNSFSIRMKSFLRARDDEFRPFAFTIQQESSPFSNPTFIDTWSAIQWRLIEWNRLQRVEWNVKTVVYFIERLHSIHSRNRWISIPAEHLK